MFSKGVLKNHKVTPLHHARTLPARQIHPQWQVEVVFYFWTGTLCVCVSLQAVRLHQVTFALTKQPLDHVSCSWHSSVLVLSADNLLLFSIHTSLTCSSLHALLLPLVLMFVVYAAPTVLLPSQQLLGGWGHGDLILVEPQWDVIWELLQTDSDLSLFREMSALALWGILSVNS